MSESEPGVQAFNDQVKAGIEDLHEIASQHPDNELTHISDQALIDRVDMNEGPLGERTVIDTLVSTEPDITGPQGRIQSHAQVKTGDAVHGMGQVPRAGFTNPDISLTHSEGVQEDKRERSVAKAPTTAGVYQAEASRSGKVDKVVTEVKRPGYTNAKGKEVIRIQNPRAAELVAALAKKASLRALGVDGNPAQASELDDGRYDAAGTADGEDSAESWDSYRIPRSERGKQ